MSDDTHSFAVHLDSLKQFARELETQIDGMTKPSNGLAALLSAPMSLGNFGEASSLSGRHGAAVTQMHELLGNVKQAIGFADDVTGTVATGYQHTDENIASALGLGSAVAPVATAVDHTVNTVTGSVASTVTNVVNTVTGAVTGTATGQGA
jgi:uncharacterized protein YoxC